MKRSKHGVRKIIIQERDRKFLAALSSLRVVDREQAKRAGGFSSTTRVNARLLKLVQAGFLKRTFVGPVGAGRKAFYSLSNKGAEIAGSNSAYLVGRRSPLLLNHQLAVNDFRFAVETSGAGASWQRFAKSPFLSVPLIPDGSIVLPEKIPGIFVEVDLGTESGRIWRRKATLYLNAALSGEWQGPFIVAVVVSSIRRLNMIRRHVRSVTRKLFYFSTITTIKERGPFSSIWLRPEGEEKTAFYER